MATITKLKNEFPKWIIEIPPNNHYRRFMVKIDEDNFREVFIKPEISKKIMMEIFKKARE